MEHDSVSDLEPRKVAHLIGIGLSKEDGSDSQPANPIGELLQLRLDDVWRSERADGKIWPQMIRRLLGPRRSEKNRSVRDVVLDPHSPAAEVETIRRRAKEKAARTDDELEHTVMTTLYFAAIANRLAFHGRRTTTYSYEGLLSSFGKLCSKPWMPPDLVSLFEAAGQACRDQIGKAEPQDRPGHS